MLKFMALLVLGVVMFMFGGLCRSHPGGVMGLAMELCRRRRHRRTHDRVMGPGPPPPLPAAAAQ